MLLLLYFDIWRDSGQRKRQWSEYFSKYAVISFLQLAASQVVKITKRAQIVNLYQDLQGNYKKIMLLFHD